MNGGLEEILPKLAPEGIESQFGSGFTARVLDNPLGMKSDAPSLESSHPPPPSPFP